MDSTAPRPALYICSTPIGNLGDVSQRLVATLQSCDILAAEDTRQTRKLLERFDIHPPLLISCHEHNQRKRRDEFVTWWGEGKVIALVSDAGTPIVSDPGWMMVDAAIEQGVPIVPVPGPSALLAALVASGLPAQPFAFFGFLPRTQADAKPLIDAVVLFPGTSILYEAPHRLLQTLRWLNERMPLRSLVLAKELTKRHESFWRGTVGEVLAEVESTGCKGEYVLLVGPPLAATAAAGDTTGSLEDGVALVRAKMQQGTTHAQAVREAAQELNLKRRDLYQATLGDDSSFTL